MSTIPEESPPISPIEEESEPRGLVGSIGRKVSRKFSGIFASRVPDAGISASASTPVHLSTTPSRNRAFSRTSRTGGSAYGYNGTYRARLASRGTLAGLSNRRGSVATSFRGRRESNANTITGEPGLSASYATGTDLNFAQRLLMANENTVTNIADLWVAAAINADNEDPFESEDESQFEGQDDENALAATPGDEFDEGDIFASGQTPRTDRFVRGSSASPLIRPALLGPPHGPSTPQRRESTATRRPSNAHLAPSESMATAPGRRFSNSVAPIFAHTGVRTPPAVLEAQQLLALADEAEAAGQDALAPIIEGSRLTQADTTAQSPAPVQEPSLMSQLPLLIIFQYGLLALHSTTHDQIFYLYLVS